MRSKDDAFGLIFCAILKLKGGIHLLNDEFMERFYCNSRLAKIPITYIGEFLRALEEVLEEEMEENPYGSISELFNE